MVFANPYWELYKIICHISNKLSRINAIIYNARDFLNLKARIQLYNSFVLPQLNYCIAVWGDTRQCLLKPLITLQKRIVRTIHYAQIRDHTSPLFKKQNSLKLGDLHQLELFKIGHQIENNYIPETFRKYHIKQQNVHNHNTRNKTDFIIQNNSKYSIINKGLKRWNTLDQEIKEIKDKNKFKKVIKSNIIASY